MTMLTMVIYQRDMVTKLFSKPLQNLTSHLLQLNLANPLRVSGMRNSEI